MAQARTTAGFTLIEVMIVLGVVAITTMIAASSYRGHSDSSAARPSTPAIPAIR